MVRTFGLVKEVNRVYLITVIVAIAERHRKKVGLDARYLEFVGYDDADTGMVQSWIGYDLLKQQSLLIFKTVMPISPIFEDRHQHPELDILDVKPIEPCIGGGSSSSGSEHNGRLK
jgi:hypothetical protein